MKTSQIISGVEYPHQDEAMAWMDARIARRRRNLLIAKEQLGTPQNTQEWWQWYQGTASAAPATTHEEMEKLRLEICAGEAMDLSAVQTGNHLKGELTPDEQIAMLSCVKGCLDTLEQGIRLGDPDWDLYYQIHVGALATLARIVTGQSDDEAEARQSVYQMYRQVVMAADDQLKTISDWRVRIAELESGTESPTQEAVATIARLSEFHNVWLYDSFEHEMDGVYRDSKYIARHGLAAFNKIDGQN